MLWYCIAVLVLKAGAQKLALSSWQANWRLPLPHFDLPHVHMHFVHSIIPQRFTLPLLLSCERLQGLHTAVCWPASSGRPAAY
jgi:hypothetical protein